MSHIQPGHCGAPRTHKNKNVTIALFLSNARILMVCQENAENTAFERDRSSSKVNDVPILLVCSIIKSEIKEPKKK
jgi:hypothetical protein